jgi:hypothetical protein
VRDSLEGGYIFGGISQSNDGDATGNYGGCDYWAVKLTGYLGVDDNKLTNNVMLYLNPNTAHFSLDFSKETLKMIVD